MEFNFPGRIAVFAKNPDVHGRRALLALSLPLVAIILTWVFQARLQSPHGLLFYFVVFGFIGALASLVMVQWRKITEQGHVASTRLRVSQERYRTLIDLMDEGFCVVEMIRDANGKDVDYRFVEINPAFEQQTGFSNGLGKTIRQLVPAHDEHWFEIYGKVARTGASIRFENHARAMGRHYDVFAFRVGGDGSDRVGILFTDITQKKQMLQDLVEAKEAAELASRAKGYFLATMSHEIRTPLAGILGMLELLSMTPLGSEQRSTLDAAWDSGKNLLRIVSDILDWSKIEDGKLELVPEATSIPQLLQGVANTFSRMASAKALTLSQHADPRLGSVHIVDALRLSQVLNNFVSNAIKFTSSGKVELRAELLEQVESGDRIRFSVKDSGIGISREARAQLFQRYRQATTDTARLYGGTGLGLAICRRLAELLDGQIELASEQGVGSTFSLVLNLPIASVPAQEAAAAPPDTVALRTVIPLFTGAMEAPVVLAVDDHPINRELLVQQIRLLGLKVKTAENGKAALKLWGGEKFAVLISDCHMPEMDGFALTRAIRKFETERQRPRIPIIAWTANALTEESERCTDAGMDDLLLKPTNIRQLKTMLAKYLHIPEAERDQLVSALQSASSAPPMDYEVLFQVIPDVTSHSQILRDFQTFLCADFVRIDEALEHGDESNIEQSAHRMKGSCQMVGATTLAKVCGAIEYAARHHDLAGARAAKPALDAAFRQLAKSYMATENPGMGFGEQDNGDSPTRLH